MSARKLIEVALPLEAINRESAREKEPFTRRHPRGLHIWWARRPLTAARAILFAQLVDDPSSQPAEFPTEELQRRERERLHEIIERLVVWENSWDERLFEEARAEILKSCGNLPTVFDPFAGGGTIPLEAQRLGLMAKASDLNPVAVLINKALIEMPARFRDSRPVAPGLADSEIRTWTGADGLAADVRAYGAWLRAEAQQRIGGLYPAADGFRVIGWIWARTVICPNPACRIEMPLVRSWWLCKKKGREAYIAPSVIGDGGCASGVRVAFEIVTGRTPPLHLVDEGTVSGRTGAVCISCQSSASVEYLRDEGIARRIGQVLLATVGEGNRRRIYLPPSDDQESAADVAAPAISVNGSMADNPRWFSPPGYGLSEFSDVFTHRQLVALGTFSDLVVEARQRVISDGGSPEYADAIATYLGLAVSRYTDLSNALCSWNHTNENVRALFSRQAVPMTWDFVEANVFGPIGLEGPLDSICNSLFVGIGPEGAAVQMSASDADFGGAVVSTDPPYYDNIGYSDLSDFFYVWLRRSLRDVYPDLLSTVLVPKADELVANPYRHGGKAAAKTFFEDGFREVFERARESASADFPVTVYYAFKQSETDASGEASTGWETLLEGMIHAGWEITSTWPVRSERTARSVGLGTNALASSIVLSLRPRGDAALITDRRGFIAALQDELPAALRKLQQGQIAPVDLPQSAIGPGMAVFSRYSSVLEPDGSRLSVRSALARINEILDEVLNEQEGDFDVPSRFAIAWYRQHGYDAGTFGDANNLATAKNTTVDLMDRHGILVSRAGRVQLIAPTDLSSSDYDIASDLHLSSWEALHHLVKALERDGIASAGYLLRAALTRPAGSVDSDLVKELAHLLYRIAEGNGWTGDALSFNTLVTSWPEILEGARGQQPSKQGQSALDFGEDD